MVKIVDGINKRPKKQRIRQVRICLKYCKYASVRRAALAAGYEVVNSTKSCDICWTDCSPNIKILLELKKWQKVNHFVGMNELCRKDRLTRNINRMLKQFPTDYNFYPPTWCLPTEYSEFCKRVQRNCTYIFKPVDQSQGKGIFLTRHPLRDINIQTNGIIQVYNQQPILLDNFKFDLRLYVLVTSYDPPTIFVYNEGLARFATAPFEKLNDRNVSESFMHLTNYAIQKKSCQYIRDDSYSGSKRRFTLVLEQLKYQKSIDTVKLLSMLDDLIIKTIIMPYTTLQHQYKATFPNHTKASSACFEILGFDILLDQNAKPVLLEVSNLFSF
ncbi:hypothetical protein GJ496_004611 [Pomphorhynchus laevis]|nr:hypothetical protein GJ496_004611 [Pomphorhynchus laevis]